MFDRRKAVFGMERKHIRKVLLIQPPYNCAVNRGDLSPNPPLGIAYIAAVLEAKGYQVEILDAFVEGWELGVPVTPEVIRAGLPFEEIKEIIAVKDPDVVGITSMFTSQRKNAHRVAALAKQVNPAAVVIMGGAHPSSAPEMVLADPNVDAVVLGEGENVIVPLLQAIEQGEDLHDLDGIGYRDISGQIVLQPKTRWVTDLDTLPFPARHLLPMEEYFALPYRHGDANRGRRPAPIIASRGCPYRCNFCTAFKVFGRTPRLRSVSNIIAEIDELANKYGVDELYFEDDQLLGKVNHTEELLDAMIARQYDLVWDTPNGISPWLLNDRILAKMKASGCYRVNIAVESGNQWVLDNIIHKPVKLDRIPEVVRLIRKHGMEPGIFLVIGNIGEGAIETKEQIRDSFRLARRVGVSPFVSILTPYPGSEVLDIVERKGYLVPDFDWDNLVISKANLQTPEWTPEELCQFVEHGARRKELRLWLRHPQRGISVVWYSLRRAPWTFPYRAFKYARSLFCLPRKEG